MAREGPARGGNWRGASFDRARHRGAFLSRATRPVRGFSPAAENSRARRHAKGKRKKNKADKEPCENDALRLPTARCPTRDLLRSDPLPTGSGYCGNEHLGNNTPYAAPHFSFFPSKHPQGSPPDHEQSPRSFLPLDFRLLCFSTPSIHAVRKRLWFFTPVLAI